MKKNLILFFVISLFSMFGCNKALIEPIQTPPSNDYKPTINIKEAKDFLAKSNSIYSQNSISYIDLDNKKDELSLFWDMGSLYEYNDIKYLEVPFVDKNNMVTAPTHTLVFWKKQNGEIEARFKTYQLAKSEKGLNTEIFLESIYDLSGKHVKTNAHQNGKKKSVEITPTSSPVLMEGSCGSYGFILISYSCNSPGDFTITCSANYELYTFNNCPGEGGANSEDWEDNTGSGGGSGGEGDGPAYDPEPELPNDEIVDVEKLLKCFDNIPNAGATYSVRLLVGHSGKWTSKHSNKYCRRWKSWPHIFGTYQNQWQPICNTNFWLLPAERS
jgi:hypothetical protein